MFVSKLLLGCWVVTFWTTAGKALQGIRELDNSNIDYATNFFRKQAVKSLGGLAGIGVAMLSNKYTVVREFLLERQIKSPQSLAGSSYSNHSWTKE